MILHKLFKWSLNYSDMPNYGASDVVKKYAGFPKLLPLPCHIEHGWTALEDALSSDLSVKKSLMLVYSQRRLEAWKRASNVRAEIIGAPFILYRKINRITQSKDARGTIAFPSHSTDELRADFNIDKYCEALKALPKKYQPVTICLYFLDIKRGRHNTYLKHGFKVVSAGSRHDLSFTKNFYNILKKHRYSTSNEVGSYTFYSVDLKIPFFLLGDSPIIVNEAGLDPNAKGSTRLTDYKIGKEVTHLFNIGVSDKITKEQLDFINNEIGLKDTISSSKLNHALWQHFFLQGFFLVAVPIYFAVLSFRQFKEVVNWIKRFIDPQKNELYRKYNIEL